MSSLHEPVEFYRGLHHALRGRLSRLHVKIEMAALPEALETSLLQEIQCMDVLLTGCRQLLLSAPPQAAQVFDIVAALQPLLKDPALAGVVQADAVSSHSLQGWPDLLVACMRPLLLNAIQHGQPPVRLLTQVADHELQLSCIDGGAGFDTSLLPSMSSPFSHVPTGGRAGLGLSVAAHLAQLQHATLFARSLPQGFAVGVSLPLRA